MKVEAEIEEVVINPSKIQPIIVNFLNGKLNDRDAKRMKCGLFNDEKQKKTCLAMSNGQMVYKGYRPDEELTYTMLAVHNKKTGKVRLIQAERWQLAPVLDKEPERKDEIDPDRIAMLNKQFGSKKVKRRTEQFEKMRVNVDSVKDQLEKTVANIEIDKEELTLQNPDDLDNDNLPPCNREAAMVEDVYSLYDILPKDQLSILAGKLEQIEQLERKTAFYVKIFNELRNDPKRKKKIAVLEYIQGVCVWLNMPIKTPKKKLVEEVCPVSPDISNFIIDNYSVMSATGRSRPSSMRDKGIMHCMILALMICNFKLDLELFGTMLTFRCGLKKLGELARVVGAMTSKDNKKMVVLKVPLPAPLSLVKRGKKK